jgi:hypothetical protein
LILLLLLDAFIVAAAVQSDVIRRLHNVVSVLQKDATIDPQDPAQGELPHLLELAQLLCQPKYLEDREKDVRLASLVACLEILGIVRASTIAAASAAL